MMDSQLQRLFSKACIIGGSPCSGKSTIAEMLAAQYGFHYYKADDHESNHMQRAQFDKQPVMFKYSKMSWDAIWSQTPEELFSAELVYYRERFPFILDDLKRFDVEKTAILEGASFLPELIRQYPINAANVVFMIPTAEFQLHHYSQRPWISSILDQCHDPKEAFSHWMKRDEMFAREVARQANGYGYPVITVDGSIDINQQFESIRTQFQLS